MAISSDPASAPAPPKGMKLRRAAYFELAARAGRTLSSTFPLLLILTVILGQHIRESSFKEGTTNSQIGDCFTKMRAAQNGMKAQQRALFDALKDPDNGEVGSGYIIDLRRRDEGGPAILAVPAPASSLDLGRSRKSAAPDGDGERSLDSNQLALGPHQFPAEREKLDVLDRSDFAAQTSARLEKLREKLSEESRQTTQRDEAVIATLSTVVEAGEAYLAEFETYAHFREKAEGLKTSLEELKTKKEAVPTPFGSFAIDPRFALLGLTLGTLYSFASFLLVLGRVRAAADAFAADYREPVTEDGSLAFWAGPAGGRRLSASGIASVASWALLCVWLLYECVRWEAVESIYFTPRAAWNYVLLGAVLIALGIGVSALLSERRWKQLQGVSCDRRRVLRLGLVAFGALLMGGGALFWRRTRASSLGKPATAAGTALSLEGLPLEDLVANRKTGVLHHKRACAGHLPPCGECEPATEADLKRLHLHGNQRLRILQACAATAVQEGRLTDAIRFLQVAIALSPGSVHLYDRLTRLYGGLKEYTAIEELFQGGLEQAQQALQREQALPMPRKQAMIRLTSQVAVFQKRLERFVLTRPIS